MSWQKQIESRYRLKPCPFCGAVLKYDEYVALTLPGKPIMRLWAHPPGKCILSGLEISKEDHEVWNRRAYDDKS